MKLSNWMKATSTATKAITVIIWKNETPVLRTKPPRLKKPSNSIKKSWTGCAASPKPVLPKVKSRIEDFHEIKSRASKRRNDHEVQLELNMERLGTKVVELHNVSKAYDEKELFTNFEYNFLKGERVGIIGKNGTGKSTFLNVVTGKQEPDTGKVVIGETVKFGYYTQKGIKIKPGQKVIDVVREFGDYIPLKKGRQISAQQLLERFLFDRKKQYDFVEKLSGGERKRLYLCTVLIKNPNFLILDEPTNDLDIVTLNVLESFLLDFPGCLIVVSHDRYFMDKIVDHLFVFKGKGTYKISPEIIAIIEPTRIANPKVESKPTATKLQKPTGRKKLPKPS